jgi:hypothetical protein
MPQGPAWLAVLLVFCVTITTLLWNVERTILGQVMTSDWLSLLNVTAAVITSVATSLYLYATWQLLAHSRSSHIASQRLMTSLHEDSLAPYIIVKFVEGRIAIKKNDKDSRLLIQSICPLRNGMIQVNNRIDMALDDIIVEGTLRLTLKNLAKNPASVRITITEPFKSLLNKEISSENEVECELSFNSKGFSFDNLKKICEGSWLFVTQIESVGPGLSAKDHLKINCKWPDPSSDDKKYLSMYYEVVSRKRIYRADLK